MANDTNKKPSSTKKTTKKKPAVKTTNTKKTASKSVKNTKKAPSKQVKTVKSATPKKITPKKNQGALEALEAVVDGESARDKKQFGKGFYLIFAIVFYAGAFFYINNIVYDNSDLLQSAIFAFAALVILFVLLLFNVHRIVFNFFFLPFKRLFKQAKQEAKKELIFSVGKSKIQTTFNKYKSISTLILYALISGALMYAVISDGINTSDKVLSIVTQAALTEIVFLIIVCSWQYLFNIIPSILDKSIDAKNGFILALSAAVMVIYVIFMIFDINYLAEIMIFILIIGFVALLGVNLNMIVGEINIFQNIRNKHNKAITRIVFLVFFSFHIYVILYASVVAFSIYSWDNESYNFAYQETESIVVNDLFNKDGQPITQVYDELGSPLNTVYDINGLIITEYIENYNNPVYEIYNASDQRITNFYDENGLIINQVYDENEQPVTDYFYNNGSLATVSEVDIVYTYGDFLYYTIVTITTLGYGDISPSYDYPIAQAWGGFLSMYGLTFFALSIGFVSNIAMEGVNSFRESDQDD